jgi:hypothetical protein
MCVFNTVVSNHVNSDHVPSFSCLDVWTNRQATSGVYAITTHTIDTLQHHSLSITSSVLDHSTTSTPYIYIKQSRFMSPQVPDIEATLFLGQNGCTVWRSNTSSVSEIDVTWSGVTFQTTNQRYQCLDSSSNIFRNANHWLVNYIMWCIFFFFHPAIQLTFP